MGSRSIESSCCVGTEVKPVGTNIERKNPRPSVFFSAGYLLLLFIAACFTIKIVFPAQQVDESQQQEAIENLQSRISILERILRANGTNEHQISHENIADGNIANRNGSQMVKRAKRSRRTSSPHMCHLEGRGGPNIISDPFTPLQRPRHPNECILWRQNDRQPPALCTMKTMDDQGGNGIKYIEIDKTGFYYVYSQLTYRTYFWRKSGHRVILASTPHSTDYKTLLKAFAPRKTNHAGPALSRLHETSDTRFAGGVFFLNKGELLGVFPLVGERTFEMNGENSYFGAYMLKSA